jgi:hypothetical protein
MFTTETFYEHTGSMKLIRNAVEGSQQMLIGRIKYLWKRIDWEVVQIVALVGTVPVMLLIGALFPSLLANYR